MEVTITIQQVKIEIYTPVEYIEKMRDELTKIGACKIGNYDHVLSFTDTKGYWRPLKGSNPFDGEIEKISYGNECKIEIRCPFEMVKKAIVIIKKIHPYEEPAINIIPLCNDFFKIQ